MKRATLVVVGAVTAVAVAAGGGFAYSVMNSRTDVGTAEAVVAPITVSISASGSLVAARSAGVYAPTSGTIAKLAVHDGDAVEAGQVLAVMAKGPLQVAVSQARAAHSAAKAQLEAIDNGVPSAIEHSAANAALSAARSQVATAAKNYSAFSHDYDDATSEERTQLRPTLRTLRTAKVQAEAALKSAKAALTRLTVASRVSLARTAARQSVDATAQALTQAEANLSNAELTAPFAGTVGFRGATVEKGAGVTAGVAVFSVVDPSRMEFEAAVNETDIDAVQKGQPANVALDAFADHTFTGTVTRVQAAAETTATGTIAFPVRISIAKDTSRLFAGMSGSTDIEVQSIKDALTVPVEAVVIDDAGRVVFVVGADNTVRKQPVTVGAATETSVQILSGLARGDRVVTTGATGLADGQRVSPN